MKKVALYALLALAGLYCLWPFLWTVLTALKSPQEVFALPITYWPRELSLENLQGVFYKRPFGRYVLNSLVVAGGATVLSIFLGSAVGYRLRLRPLQSAMALQRWLLVGAIVPPALLVIPLFVLMKKLQLVNNYLGLILSYTFLNLPFAVWMLHAAFRQLPRELDEAALLDGLSRWGILWRIIMPLSRPALAVTATLVFIFSWNEFIIALTLMPQQEMYTVPVGIAMLSGVSVYEMPWGEINAAVAITTLPVILLIAAFQRWIIEGLTRGAVKA
jgi:ABC-type glycerol-3-phosphate transport system permease component